MSNAPDTRHILLEIDRFGTGDWHFHREADLASTDAELGAEFDTIRTPAHRRRGIRYPYRMTVDGTVMFESDPNGDLVVRK